MVADVVVLHLPGGAGSLLRARTVIHRPLEEAFLFFADARNLEAITPPSLGFQITTELGDGATRRGMIIEYRIRLRRIPLRWRTRIARFDPPHAFVDEQLRGPYRWWRHAHYFERLDERTTLIADEVRYRPRGGPLVAPLVDRLFAAREVRDIFRWRARRLAELLDEAPPRPGAGTGQVS